MAGKNRFSLTWVYGLLTLLFFIFLTKNLFRGSETYSDSQAFSRWKGKPFPDVNLSDANQNSFRTGGKIEDLFKNGKEKIVFSFWATWCEPCVSELKLLQKNKTSLEDQGVSVILVNYDGGIPEKTIPEVKAWLISQDLRLETLFDFNEALLRKFEIYALPFSIGIQAHNSQNNLNNGEPKIFGNQISWGTLGELDWTALPF